LVEKLLEKFPEEIESKKIRSEGFITSIGMAFIGKEYKVAELLLRKGRYTI
jgi:hypothetical protein